MTAACHQHPQTGHQTVKSPSVTFGPHPRAPCLIAQKMSLLFLRPCCPHRQHTHTHTLSFCFLFGSPLFTVVSPLGLSPETQHLSLSFGGGFARFPPTAPAHPCLRLRARPCPLPWAQGRFSFTDLSPSPGSAGRRKGERMK